MLFKTLVNASLLGAAIAQPLQQHQHHEHKVEKRAMETVTTTNVVVLTVGGSNDGSSADVLTISKNTDLPSINSQPTEPAQVVPSVSHPTTFSSIQTTGSQTSTASTSSGSSGSGSFDGGAKGVSYSPYNSDGSCKSTSQVQSDFAGLTGFEIIRIYGVDCNQVANVLAAKSANQKLFVGIYYVDDIQGGVSAISSAISSSSDYSWDDIYTVSVGNELVNDGSATVSQIGSYVSTAKSALKAAGYNGPVVSVDTFIAVINNPGLCQYSDYIAVNAHAYFDGGVTAQQAGTWVLEQIQRVYTACGDNKSVFITETGWPSKGDTNGKAVPSTSNQQDAISAIKSSCGNDVILFTAYNDMWKQPGSLNCEQYWGFLNN